MKCKVCGKEFDSIYPRQTLCGPECVKTSRLNWQREYARKSKEKKKTGETKPRTKKKKENELVTTAIAARAAGMTYGQFVAQQNAQYSRIIRKELK